MSIDEKIRKFGKAKVLEDLGHYGLSKKLSAALKLKEKAKQGNSFVDIGNVLNECGELELKSFEILFKKK